jgi:hypothetical protein
MMSSVASGAINKKIICKGGSPPATRRQLSYRKAVGTVIGIALRSVASCATVGAPILNV